MGRIGWLKTLLVTLLLLTGCGKSPEENERALRHATRQRDPNLVQIKALIADGVDLDARDATGKTVLFEVAGSRDVEVARLLVAHGADISIADRWQITPLHEALRRRHTEMARFLINAGAEVTVRTYGGETPLHEAAKKGELEIVDLLVARGAEINATTGTGETPLLWAASEGRYEIAEFLIAKGADVNTQGGEGSASPLHLAAEMGHRRLVQLLLASGASVDLKDRLGHTPAIRAMQQNNENVVTILAEAGAEINLHLAAYLGDIAAARRLIETGSDVNIRDDLGCTPLHYAALQGQAEVAELLIGNGADVNAGDKYGNPPLHLAKKHIEVTRILVDHGANLNAEDQAGQTALREAILRGDKDVVDFLIDQGADIDLRSAAYIGRLDKVKELLANGADINVRREPADPSILKALSTVYPEATAAKREPQGDTPLHRAVQGAHDDVVEFLVNAGAEIEARGNDGQAPLYEAAYLGFTEIAKTLIAHGADINTGDGGDYEGETPLQIAARCGHTATVALLLDHGADAKAKDKHGYTALEHAWDEGFADVVALLGGDPNDLALEQKKPYTIVVRNPAALKQILLPSEYDASWIPTQADIEGLDLVLKSYLTENTMIRSQTQASREYLLANLRRYSHEYAGFIHDGTSYILCNLVIRDFPATPNEEEFTQWLDSMGGNMQVIFDAEKRTVVRVDCM